MKCLRIQLFFKNQRSPVFLNQGFLTVHKSVILFNQKNCPSESHARFFAYCCCLKSGIHEFMNIPQIAKFTFKSSTGRAWLFSIDLPDHGKEGFHVMRCVRRCMEMVVPCRFGILLTFLVNWRTGSVCKGVPPSFFVLGNKFSFFVPGSSRRIVWVFWIFFFSMRRVSPLLFHQPAKVCILESHLRSRRCVGWVLIYYSSCYRFSPKLSASRDF